MIKPFLRDIINDHKTQGEWKVNSGNEVIDYKTQGEWEIQLIMIINFISSKDSDEILTIRTKSNNIEIMMGNERDEKEPFQSLLQNYQEDLKDKMRGTEFVFHSVDLLYYNLHKVSLIRGGSYIDSPKWLKNKKATINPKNNDDKCFKYAATVTLDYQNIKNNPQRTSRIKSFIEQYDWKERNFPSPKKEWKKFELTLN